MKRKQNTIKYDVTEKVVAQGGDQPYIFIENAHLYIHVPKLELQDLTKDKKMRVIKG